VTAQQVIEALRHRHPEGMGEWTFVVEAWGIDAYAVGAWASAKAQGCAGISSVRYARVSYEVKVSRSDFRKELVGYTPGPDAMRSRSSPGWPIKAARALEMSHYYFFAVPKGLLKPEELAKPGTWDIHEEDQRPYLWLPEGVGLVEVDSAGRCFATHRATKRVPKPWGEHEIAELLRYKHNGADRRALREQLRTQTRLLEDREVELERARALLAPIVPALVEPGSRWRGGAYLGAREQEFEVLRIEGDEVVVEEDDIAYWGEPRKYQRRLDAGAFLLRFKEVRAAAAAEPEEVREVREDGAASGNEPG
jgi:hypothetical protein